jgi:GNAT superfamily N-acetyltransferase
MPPRHESAGSILPKLQGLAAKTPGVVAIRDGEVVGFMMGEVLSSFRGKRTVYTPEWAHAADPKARRDIYRAMYAHIAHRWVDDGCLVHLITALADQQEALDAFFWLGFAMIGVDAMRDLGPVRHDPPNIAVRQAGTEDTEAVMELLNGYERHLAAAPIFLCDRDAVESRSIEQQLADPKRPSWLACDGQVPIGYMHIQPGNPAPVFIISDPKTASIKAAFTDPHYRGKGIGAALLSRAIEWARSQEYERCAVDFEPQNIPGARFWGKHFRPVCYSVIRYIDERIGEGSQRPRERTDN